jgi:hypothetical protein
MAWKLVEQPNGLLARWSDVVDNFTDYDMTEFTAYNLCRQEYGMMEKPAGDKISRARENPLRFTECLETIEQVHGASTRDEMNELLSRPL